MECDVKDVDTSLSVAAHWPTVACAQYLGLARCVTHNITGYVHTACCLPDCVMITYPWMIAAGLHHISIYTDYRKIFTNKVIIIK